MASLAPSQPSAFTERRLNGWALFSVLGALLLTLLLAALDQTIVSTALPHIISELNGTSKLSWIGTAYLLTSATTVPIIGKLSDEFGRKWFMVGGVGVFLLGSMLCGVAQTIDQLIYFRAFQGIGAAALLGITITIIGDIFPPAERARWQGLFGIAFGLSSVIGPLVGGWITDHSTWRWVFYVNVPLGLVAFFALLVYLPANISIRTSEFKGWASLSKIDILGAILAAAATICLLLGLTWGSQGAKFQGYDWNSPQVVGILIASAVLYIAFIVAEARSSDPILPLSFFRNETFAVDAILALLIGMLFLGVIYYLPTYIQGVLGQAATNSGILVTPLTFTLIIGSIVGGQLISRTGRYQWVTIMGAVILTLGLFLLSQITPDTATITVIRNMLVIGLGIGFIFPIITLAVQNSVPRTQLGTATGAITYLRSLGSTIGIAIFGAVINNSFINEMGKRFPAPPQGVPANAFTSFKDESVIQRVLTDANIKHQIVGQAVKGATASIPPGPAHDTIVAQVTSNVTMYLNQIFEAGRQSLGFAIVNGFRVSMFLSILLIVVTFFLRDVPMTQARSAVSETEDSESQAAGMSMHI